MPWSTATLGDIATWGSGGTPKRAETSYFGAGTPWLSIADLNDGVVSGAKESLTPEGIARSSAKVVPPGTIFVAMYGSIGKLGLGSTHLCTSQAIAFAVPDTALVETRYLFHFLLAERPKLIALGRGGTQMNIGQADLKDWPIPLPAIEEQRRIADILDRADALRAKRREALALLDDLTQSIFLDMFGDPQTNPQGWVRRPLGSIVRGIDNGSSPICEARPATEDEWGVLKLSALKGGTFDAAENKAYLGAVDAMARNEVRSGDLLMTRKNTRDLVGAVALVRDVRPRLLMPDLVFRLDVDEAVARKSYLQALLMHPRKRPEIADLSNGSAASMPNISKARLRTLPLELPPLESQLVFERRVLAVQNLHTRTLEAAVADHDLFDTLQQRAFAGLL